MRVISTVHKQGWEVYGERWLEGLKFWPKDTEFILYAEGFDLDNPRVECRRIEAVPRAAAFKRRYEHYKAVWWMWDVVRFSNKVFASYDALHDYQGLALWLDADCITYKRIPKGYVEKMLPQGHYLAMYKRIGTSTETGFVIRDCSNPNHCAFMEMWVRWLESDAFKTLPQWCDAYLMDLTVRRFEKEGLIRTHSLSGEFDKDMHPMAKTDIARYIDHLKGNRKTGEFSKENIFRQAA